MQLPVRFWCWADIYPTLGPVKNTPVASWGITGLIVNLLPIS